MPTGGAITVNGTSGSNGGTSSYFTGTLSTGFTIGTRTDWSDAGSGLASSTLTRESAPLLANSCGAYGSLTTITGNPDQTSLVNGTCYRYLLTVTDNVGNVTTTTTVVMVDNTAPAAPTLTLSNATGTAFVDNTGKVAYFKSGSSSGGFDVAASASDAETSVAASAYTFPSAFSNWGVSGSNASRTYALSTTSSSSPGSQNVTATNGASLTSGNASFSVVADATAPTGGVLSINSTSAALSATTSYNNTGSFTIGTRTDYTETMGASASGLATSVLTRESATLSGDACGTFGSSSTIATGSGTVQNSGAGISTGTCYRYTLTGTDNVGNAATIQTIVKVDTTAPSAPTLTLATSSSGLSVTGSTLFVKTGTSSGSFTVTDSGPAADTETAIASYSFPTLGGGWNAPTTPSTVSRSYSLSTTATAHSSQSVTATNGAGLASSATTFSVALDGTGPSGVTITHPTGPSTQVTHTLTFSQGTDTGGSGVASWLIERAYAAFSSGTTCPASPTGSYATFTGSGSSPSSTLDNDLTGASNGCYWYRITSTDAVGNSTATTVSAPYAFNQEGVTLYTPVDSGSAYQSGPGATVFVKPGTGGVFRIAVPVDVFADTTFPAGPGSGLAMPSTTVNTGLLPPQNLALGSLVVADTSGFLSSGKLTVAGATGTCSYTGITGGTTFTGITGCTGTATNSGAVTPLLTVTSSSSNPGNLSGTYYVGAGYVWTSGYTGTQSLTFTQHTPGTQTVSVNVTADSTAPALNSDGSSGVAPNPRNSGATYTISATDGGAGVKAIYYTLDGTTPTYDSSGNATSPTVKLTGLSGTVTIPNTQGSYAPKYIFVDNVDNASSVVTGTTIVVDKTNPTDSIAISSSAPTLNGQVAAKISGTTVFYRGTSGSTGSLVFTDTVSDTGGAGASQATFNSLGGTTTGFTFTGSTDTSSTYDSNTLQWTDGSTSAPTINITSRDAATNNSTGTTLTFANDSSGPSSSATSVTTPRSTSASITVTGNDGSGVGVYEVCYTTDGTTPAYTTGGSTTCTAGSTATISLTTQGSYALKYVSVDQLGNAGSVVTGQTVLLDTTAPTVALTAPTTGPLAGSVTVSGTGADTGGSGLSSLTTSYRTAGSGSYTNITTSSTSPVSGSWDTSSLVNGSYDIRISGSDAAGNTATPVVSTLTVTNPARTLVSPSSLSTTGTSLTMTFTGPLDAASMPPLSAFVVKVGGVSRTPTAISISGSTVVLTLSPAVSPSPVVVTVDYPTVTAPPLKDARGNNIAIFTNATVTNNSTVGVVVATPTPAGDTTPPHATSSAANGNVVTIEFDEDLVGAPSFSAFALTGGSPSPRTPQSISISGRTVTLTFAIPVQAGETLSVGYSGSAGLGDAAGNPVSPFTIGVDNRTPAFAGSANGNIAGALGGTAGGGSGPFTLTGAYANSKTVVLTFSRTLGGPDLPLAALRVTGSTGGTHVPISIGRSGSTLTLTLADAVLSGETVLVSYNAPLTGGIQDQAGSLAVAFAGALATNTTVGVPIPAPLATAPPDIQAISPNDGLTIPAVTQIDIVATKDVTWSNLKIVGPAGPAATTTLADGVGTSITRVFSATAIGSYTISGTMKDATNPPVSFTSHFTLFTPPPPAADNSGTTIVTNANGTTTTTLIDAPPVSRVADRNEAGAIVASNGVVSMQWPATAFKDATVIKVDPIPVTNSAALFQGASSNNAGSGNAQSQASKAIGAIFAAGGQAVQVTATRSSDGTLVRTFDDPLEFEFPNAPAGTSPSSSEDGLTWTPIPQLPAGTTTLPPGQRDGWFRDANGTIHILSRHLTYFGVLIRPASAPLAATVAVSPNPYLKGRTTFGFLVRVTKTSTVRATLRKGKSTLMVWPALKVSAGTYVLKRQLPKRSLAGQHAILEVEIATTNAKGKKVGRVRMFRQVAFLKAPPVIPARPIVLLVNGTDSRRSLQAALKKSFQIAYFTTSRDSYQLVADKKRNVSAVVIDMKTAPAGHSERLALIRNLRYLFPDIKIVVATNSARLRVQVVRAGANTTIPAPVSTAALRPALSLLFRR